MKCENCNKYKAEYKDYRTDETGSTNKILSCEWCSSLSDVNHYRVRVEKLDAKDLLTE